MHGIMPRGECNLAEAFVSPSRNTWYSPRVTSLAGTALVAGGGWRIAFTIAAITPRQEAGLVCCRSQTQLSLSLGYHSVAQCEEADVDRSINVGVFTHECTH